MSTKKKTSRRRASLDAKPTHPLTWKDLSKWNRRYHMVEVYREMRRAKVDPRLVFLTFRAGGGVLHGLSATSNTRVRRQLLDFAAAEGATEHGCSALDTKQLWIVTDWLVRCVLPLAVERLPGRCGPMGWAAKLRKLQPLVWSLRTIDAMQALSPLWGDLRDNGIREAAARERPIVSAVEALSTAAMLAMTRILQLQLDSYVAARAVASSCLDAALQAEAGLNAELIEPTLPSLLKLLSEVEQGDGQQSIAIRCVWPVALPTSTNAA